MADQEGQKPQRPLQYQRKAPGDATPRLLFGVGFMIGMALSLGAIIAIAVDWTLMGVIFGLFAAFR
jgi:hypothetical protein